MEINIDQILPNPKRPRKNFEEDELRELCYSIREFGIIQPVVIRKTGECDKYILIEGERRLSAASLLGLKKVPVIIQESPREQLERKLDKQQTVVTDKLRLLALPGEVQLIMSEHDVSDRHARALLKLNDNTLSKQVIEKIVKYDLNVKQSEKIIDELLEKRQEGDRKKERISFINYKLYINTIKKAFKSIRDVEEDATYFQEDKGDYIEMKITIPKRKKENVSRETFS